MLVRTAYILYIMCARCLSSVMFAVCQRSSFLPPNVDFFKSKTCCARQCPSELGAALTCKVFRKASAKVRPFSELTKRSTNFF